MGRFSLLPYLLIGLGGCSKPTLTDINDLAFPVVEAFRNCNEVQNVEVLVACQKPTCRIVHIRDWHFVPFDLFELDVKQGAGKQLSDKEVGDLYAKHLNDVDQVTREQEKLLLKLAGSFGLKTVFAEGVTPQNLTAYREAIKNYGILLKDVGDLKTKRLEIKGRAKVIDNEIDGLENELRKEFLKYGSTGILMGLGKIDVSPLDDNDLLQKAKPIAEGKVVENRENIEKRHDGQVEVLLKHGGVVVVVLGGRHDLTDSVRRLGGGRTEYVRVTTKKYRKVAGND